MYDDNLITIDGETELSFTEDVLARYEGYGWHTQTVHDVNDSDELRQAIYSAKAETDRPSIIKVPYMRHTGDLLTNASSSYVLYLDQNHHRPWKSEPRHREGPWCTTGDKRFGSCEDHFWL